MKKLLKNIVERTPVYFTLRNFVENRRQRKDYINWKESGRKDPPPHIAKQKILRAYAEKFGLKILVETGTYYGDMVEAMKCYFEQIYSIELSVELYGKAKKRVTIQRKNAKRSKKGLTGFFGKIRNFSHGGRFGIFCGSDSLRLLQAGFSAKSMPGLAENN